MMSVYILSTERANYQVSASSAEAATDKLRQDATRHDTPRSPRLGEIVHTVKSFQMMRTVGKNLINEPVTL